MKMSKSELNEMIEEAVRKELNRIVPMLVKESITNLLSNLLTEGEGAKVFKGNSDKRLSLTEISKMSDEDTEEWPTMKATPASFDRTSIRSRFQAIQDGEDVSGMINPDLPSTMITDMGTAIPIDQSKISSTLKNNLTRNYSDVLKNIKNRNNG